MITFEYEGKGYRMTEEWEEMTLRQFIRMNKIQESNSILNVGEELLTQQLLECLCDADVGEFDDMSFGIATDLLPHLYKIIDKSKEYNEQDFTSFGTDVWEIDGKEYTYHKDPNLYSLGEVSDIKTYISNKQNEWDYLADIAAVMIRPATKQTTEAGVEYYKLSKRTPFDFEPNKKVVLGMRLKDVTRVLRFFLSGLTVQSKDMKNYLQVKVEVK